MTKTTDFGFESVPEEEKRKRVDGVFDSVADRYDLMNDLMSGGLHRLWKRFAVEQSFVTPGARVLDVAGGTGDLARLFAERVGPHGAVVLTDINASMLAAGRDRLLDAGRLIPAVRCDGERLPFPSDCFDCVSIAFGLRNMTRKDAALAEMRRVLKPGGRLVVVSFHSLEDRIVKDFLNARGKSGGGSRHLPELAQVAPDRPGFRRRRRAQVDQDDRGPTQRAVFVSGFL
jgi:demethylmenaquinone methyltransferase/2-methoxy-6-polyprenyl-1,4-benzoquinol methylase